MADVHGSLKAKDLKIAEEYFRVEDAKTTKKESPMQTQEDVKKESS